MGVGFLRLPKAKAHIVWILVLNHLVSSMAILMPAAILMPMMLMPIPTPMAMPAMRTPTLTTMPRRIPQCRGLPGFIPHILPNLISTPLPHRLPKLLLLRPPVAKIVLRVVQDLPCLRPMLVRGPRFTRDHGCVFEEREQAAAMFSENELLLTALDGREELCVVGLPELLACLVTSASPSTKNN